MHLLAYKKITSAFIFCFLLIGLAAQAQDGIATAPAPVANVISFYGQSEQFDNSISWASVTEANCSYFSLERSCDHVMWEEAIKLKGEGNSNQQLPYAWKDESPYSGFTYYRLKAVAGDGSYSYTPSIVVESKMKLSVDIYPNPSDGIIKITVLGKDNESSKLYIKSMMGQVLFFSDVINNSALEIDIESYPEGIYAVEVESGNGSTVQRLVKR